MTQDVCVSMRPIMVCGLREKAAARTAESSVAGRLDVRAMKWEVLVLVRWLVLVTRMNLQVVGGWGGGMMGRKLTCHGAEEAGGVLERGRKL